MFLKNHYRDILEKIENGLLDITKREFKKGNVRIAFLFISQLTNKSLLSQSIIKPISEHLKNNDVSINAKNLKESFLYDFESFVDNNEEKIIEYIVKGFTVILFSNDKSYIVSDLKQVEKRAVSSPELTFTIRGPRDCFNESIDTNLSLIRYRIKDPSLKIKKTEIGRRTKTQIAIVYFEDIANEGILKDVTERLQNIDVDGIVDSGEIQNLILNKPFNLFPQAGVIERSDMAVGALLEGKILILVEGAALALIVPKLFSEFFTSCEDIYDNKYLSVLSKFIRLISAFISTSITALYVAIVTFHIDTLPADFVIAISQSTIGVPFQVVSAALILELLLELLREALLRVPKQIGPGIGIVGGIVIGQAAIAAKVFNPLMLIVVSISLLSSFTIPDYTIMNPLRVLKFFLIVVSSAFGLVGFTLGITAILITVVSNDSFKIPFFAPFSPLKPKEVKESFLFDKKISNKRPSFLKTKDKFRSKQ